MTKDMTSWSWLAVLGIIIDFLQILSLAFYSRIKWNWDPNVTAWLTTLTNAARAYNFGDSSGASIRTVFYIIAFLVLIMLLDAVWVGWQLSENRVRFTFTIRLLRTFADLMIGPFYIPVRMRGYCFV